MIHPEDARELRQAAKAAERAIEKRDRMIRGAHANGASLREIADAVGTLTHSGIARLIKRQEGTT